MEPRRPALYPVQALDVPWRSAPRSDSRLPANPAGLEQAKSATRWLTSTILTCILFVILGASVLGGATFTVTKTDDTNDGICGSDCSIREAVAAANGASGATIIIPAGTYPINLGAISVFSSIQFRGAKAETTILDGQDKSVILSIAGSTTTNHIQVSGLTFRRGRNYEGGALAIWGGEVSIRDSVFRENFASQSGGAIFAVRTAAVSASLDLLRCTIMDNSAGQGGGIFSAVSTLTITSTTISGNIAREGGGLYAYSPTVIVNSRQPSPIHHQAAVDARQGWLLFRQARRLGPRPGRLRRPGPVQLSSV